MNETLTIHISGDSIVGWTAQLIDRDNPNDMPHAEAWSSVSGRGAVSRLLSKIDLDGGQA